MESPIIESVKLGVGITLLAALVAAVLSLTVVAQSIMGSGQMTMQTGVDQISIQEFEKYNGKTVSGVEVVSALSLYSSQDMAVVIQTKVCRNMKNWGYNYGALLGQVSDTTKALATLETSNTRGTQMAIGAGRFDSSKSVDEQSALTDFYIGAGDRYFTGALQLVNGLTKQNNDTLGTSSSGDPEYILQSAKFTAYLIKDDTGAIIGLYFVQQ